MQWALSCECQGHISAKFKQYAGNTFHVVETILFLLELLFNLLFLI